MFFNGGPAAAFQPNCFRAELLAFRGTLLYHLLLFSPTLPIPYPSRLQLHQPHTTSPQWIAIGVCMYRKCENVVESRFSSSFCMTGNAAYID